MHIYIYIHIYTYKHYLKSYSYHSYSLELDTVIALHRNFRDTMNLGEKFLNVPP